MIIFLYGPDAYRSRQKLNEIIESYRKVHKEGFNLRYFSGNDSNFEEFADETQTVSMFKEKKLIVFKNILLSKVNEEKFLDFFKKNKDSVDLIVIYEEKDIDERKALVKFLKENAKSQEFNSLEGEKLKNWIKKEISNYKKEIEPNAVDELINFAGNDLWQISNEVKKLASFAKGRKVKKEDVELLVRPKIESDIFKTIDSLLEKRKDKALSLIHKHLEKGDSPLYLLSMINFQFRNLVIVKDLMEKNVPYYAVIKQTKLHPFVVKKSYWQAQRFTLSQIKKIYQKIFQADLAIKTGKIEPETALDLLISEI